MTSDMECSICFEIFDCKHVPMITNCGHTFCNKCVRIKQKCFICSTEIISLSTNYLFMDIMLKLKSERRKNEKLQLELDKINKNNDIEKMLSEMKKDINKISIEINKQHDPNWSYFTEQQNHSHHGKYTYKRITKNRKN